MRADHAPVVEVRETIGIVGTGEECVLGDSPEECGAFEIGANNIGYLFPETGGFPYRRRRTVQSRPAPDPELPR